MKVVLEKNAIMPERAHETDAGLDLFSPIDFYIKPHGRFTVFTGVHIELPEGTVGEIRAKSGLMKECGIITQGTIDEGYTGVIGVTLINTSDEYKSFQRGDKVAQLVVVKCEYPTLEVVDSLAKTERGNKGFGSTGSRKEEINEHRYAGSYRKGFGNHFTGLR